MTGQPVHLLPTQEVPAASAAEPGAGQAEAGSSADGQATREAASEAGSEQAGTDTQASTDEPPAVEGAAAADAKPTSPKGVTYRIRKGDTLWDISATYYRNPWLYLRLARANSIKNPDLIFAGAKLFIPEN